MKNKKHLLNLFTLLLAAYGPSSAHAQQEMDLSDVQGVTPFLTETTGSLAKSRASIHPFINSALPRPENYDGGFFELNHMYPSELPKPPKEYPWKKVTNNGPITLENANAYVEALKEYVSDDMRVLVFDKNKPNNPNWYQSIWLGTEREPIHGMYVGSGFPAGTLTGQKIDLTTYVYTLYDPTAAKTLGDIWGTTLESAKKPKITTETTQYAEGSVIVKFSFVTACGSDWAPMEGAATWQIYAPVNTSNGSARSDSACENNGSNGNTSTPVITNVYLMQFDIIVKDSVAAPETGWVFSTLVYDKDAKGKDAWDKMVPLGATWGGDPDVINLSPEALTPPAKVNPKLKQNWINMETPEYTRSTLGWDGRLSGPNDGAVVQPAWAGDRYYHKGLNTVGCMACHSSAQYPMTSFLLPAITMPASVAAPPLSSDNSASALVLADPGSEVWMKYFQSRDGKTPMGPVTKKGGITPVALDYDMVTAFKAIPAWEAAMKAKEEADYEQ